MSTNVIENANNVFGNKEKIVNYKMGDFKSFEFPRVHKGSGVQIGKFQVHLFIGQDLFYPTEGYDQRSQWIVQDFTPKQMYGFIGSYIYQSFVERDGEIHEEAFEMGKVGWELYNLNGKKYNCIRELNPLDYRRMDISRYTHKDGNNPLYDRWLTQSRVMRRFFLSEIGTETATKDNFKIQVVRNRIRGLRQAGDGYKIRDFKNDWVRGIVAKMEESRDRKEQEIKAKANKEAEKTAPVECPAEYVVAGVVNS